MNLLVIGDTHFPGQHDDYLQHVKDTADQFSIDKFVHVGDLADFHYISRHQTEPDADNALIELDKARLELAKWTAAFPDMKICSSNHDQIPYRQVAALGIPKQFMRSLHSLLGLPDTWSFHSKVVIDDIIIEHGIGSNGIYGAKRTAEKYRTHYIQGHTHSYAGVWWLDGPFDSIFAMQVGCGIDVNKYHARYGREIFKHNVALGCGVVLNADTEDKLPIFVPMQYDRGVVI